MICAPMKPQNLIQLGSCNGYIIYGWWKLDFNLQYMPIAIRLALNALFARMALGWLSCGPKIALGIAHRWLILMRSLRHCPVTALDGLL